MLKIALVSLLHLTFAGSLFAQTCEPDFSHPAVEALRLARRLNPVEAEHVRISSGWIATNTSPQSRLWVYALDANVLVDIPPSLFKRVTLITKPSGHVLVVTALGGDHGYGEVIPTPGNEAILTEGIDFDPSAWRFKLDDQGLWSPRRDDIPNTNSAPARARFIAGALKLSPVFAWWERLPGGVDYWTVTAADGQPLELKTGDVVELRNGQRLVRTDQDDFELRPPRGFSLALATDVKDVALRTFLRDARSALDDALTALPRTADLKQALPVFARVENHQDLPALVGPDLGGERWVIMKTRDTNLFVFPPDRGPAPEVHLVSGWRVYARDGRWYTRGTGGSPSPPGGPSGGSGFPRPPPPFGPDTRRPVEILH